MFLEGKVIEEVVAGVIEAARKQHWLKRLFSNFKRKHRILVLGSSGVGKTSVIDYLRTISPEVIDYMSRTEFAGRQKIRIEDEPFIFVDTPGQIGHKARRMTAIREEMSAGISGVLNVVAFGYHETKALDRPSFDLAKLPPEDFLSRCRRLELQSLGEWNELLGDKHTSNWLITVINKADLWWKRRDDVFKYYREGDYFTALGTAQTLQPVTLEFSSILKRFWSEGTMSGTFDEADRSRTRADLLRALLSAVGRQP